MDTVSFSPFLTSFVRLDEGLRSNFYQAMIFQDVRTGLRSTTDDSHFASHCFQGTAIQKATAANTPQTFSRHEISPQRRRPIDNRLPKSPLNLSRTPGIFLELRPSRLPSSLRKSHSHSPRHRRPTSVAKLWASSHLGRISLLRPGEHQIRLELLLLHNSTSRSHPPLAPSPHNELPRLITNPRPHDATSLLGPTNNSARYLARPFTSSVSTQRQTPPSRIPPLQHNSHNLWTATTKQQQPDNRTLLPHSAFRRDPHPLPLRPHPAPPSQTDPTITPSTIIDISNPEPPSPPASLLPPNFHPSPLARAHHHRDRPRPATLFCASGDAAAARGSGELSGRRRGEEGGGGCFEGCGGRYGRGDGGEGW